MVNPTKGQRRQRGASLVEALVAVLVMGFGMMAVVGIQGRLRNSGDMAKQRAEATRIAGAEMESLRAYAALTRSDEVPDEALVFDEIVSGTTEITAASTTYTVGKTVTPLDDGGIDVRLNISWQDRSTEDNETLNLQWQTSLAAVEPKLIAAAFVPPDFGISQRRAQDRHPAVPLGAKTLSPQRSVFKPVPSGSVALVFNSMTGMVTGLCDGLAAVSTKDITEADVAACANSYAAGAYLLSGHVRFSLAAVPDPASPNDTVLPVGLAVDLTSSVHPAPPVCYSDSSLNLLAGMQAVDYYCVIPPRAPTAGDGALYWSGKSRLTGLSLAAGGYRVCRYSDDYNGDGKINNAEHPQDYLKLAESLARQNFLVVKFEAGCPAGQKIDIPAQVFRSTVTVAHQP
jgi:Tfp pilus assembly protein PilV